MQVSNCQPIAKLLNNKLLISTAEVALQAYTTTNSILKRVKNSIPIRYEENIYLIFILENLIRWFYFGL